jgi:hypothetical protein
VNVDFLRQSSLTAFGTELTFPGHERMSASKGKADITRTGRRVG